MEEPENTFQYLLFRVALLSMMSDGEIDLREISEIKWMDVMTNYFKGFDVNNGLQTFIADLKSKDKYVVDDLLNDIAGRSLTTPQQLTILEIALKLIYADRKARPSEILFVQALRSTLPLENELIKTKFSFASFLVDKDYQQHDVKQECRACLIKDFVLPDITTMPAYI